MKQVDLTLSVVSHGQMDMIAVLLQDIAVNCQHTSLEVILTLNIPEELPDSLAEFAYPVLILRNKYALGFGENHNRAFKHAKAPHFCVINPDIRVASNIFPILMNGLQDPMCGVIAPLIVNGAGTIEDSARKFPTPFKILCKAFGGCRGQDYKIDTTLVEPDWVGGMFMVFRTDTYRLLNGFNTKYFLYYEDVDLCARIRLKGLKVVINPVVQATHLARRSSHKSFTYSFMHIRSMLRFFTSITFLKVMWYRVR